MTIKRKNKTSKRSEVRTEVTLILDKSGSMSSCWEATISSFNEYLADLKRKAKKQRIDFSLTLFDTVFENRYRGVDVREVRPLNKETYCPEGMTALNDAFVETVEKAYARIKELKGKVASLVVVLTDGEENSSREHDAGCVRDLIKKLEKEGNWTFVYLGANQDAWATGGSLGFAAGNTAAFTSDPAGMRSSFVGLTATTADFMKQTSTGSTLNAQNLGKNFVDTTLNKEKGGGK